MWVCLCIWILELEQKLLSLDGDVDADVSVQVWELLRTVYRVVSPCGCCMLLVLLTLTLTRLKLAPICGESTVVLNAIHFEMCFPANSGTVLSWKTGSNTNINYVYSLCIGLLFPSVDVLIKSIRRPFIAGYVSREREDIYGPRGTYSPDSD